MPAEHIHSASDAVRLWSERRSLRPSPAARHGSQREESHFAGQLAQTVLMPELISETPSHAAREGGRSRIVNVANTTYTPQHTLVSPYPAKCSRRLSGD